MSKDLVVIDGKTLTRQDIENAIIANGPVLSDAADSLGIARYELEDILNRDQHLNRVYINELEVMCDYCIKNVYAGVKGGNINLSQWVLERLRKEKGFSTKAELTLVKAEKSVEDMSLEEAEAKLADIHNELLGQGYKVDPETGKMLPPPRVLQAWDKPGWKPGE